MKKIDAAEAQDNFEQLLDLVQKGEEFIITRGGAAIAHLVPADFALRHAEAREAANAVRKMNEGVTLQLNLKELIDEGRPPFPNPKG